MGEIDHTDDTVNHGVTHGDETIDGAQSDPVDQLLHQDEEIHGEPLLSLCVKEETGAGMSARRSLKP